MVTDNDTKKKDARGEETVNAKSRATASGNQPIHTPGPWEVTNDGFRVVNTPERAGELRLVCSTAWNQASRTFEARANARLIAAAPDMLAALKASRVWMLLAIGSDPETTHLKAIQNAKDDLALINAAIARAEEK